MQAVLDFIQTYWSYLSAGIIILIEVLLWIFRKSKIVDPSIYARLVTLVQVAEDKFGPGHGDKKLQYVIDTFKAGSCVKYYDFFIKDCIEDILATPQKKGAKDGEKKS